jgi:hypothetical protein
MAHRNIFTCKTITLFCRKPSAHDVGVWNQITTAAIMKRSNIEILPTEELWVLYQKVTATLKAKIIAEKKVLEDITTQRMVSGRAD